MTRFPLVLMAVPVILSASFVAVAAPDRYDVVVHGATPAGCAAAIAAGRHGHSVLLVEPTSRIGGMITNGLSHPDFRTFEAITGAFADLADRTLASYVAEYGADSEQVETTLRGTHAEPKVSLRVLEAMLADHESIEVVTRTSLGEVRVEETAGRRRITSIVLRDATGALRSVAAEVFVDATYEGDLAAAAGVPCRVGREARSEFGESLAPERADDRVQGYNFRLTVTAVPENRVLPGPPPGYDREEYLEVLPMIADGRITRAFLVTAGGSKPDAIYKVQEPRLPNAKHDVNDMSHGRVRLSLPQISDAWPDGDAATRKRLFADHLRHNVGLMHFLQNDEAVPEPFRKEARKWGLCRDEFTDSNHLPVQLYVREARRIVGRETFTQRSVGPNSEDDVRSVFVPDAIAMGDYGPNCHGTGHEGPRFGGRHTGEFYHRVAPYQIPYGVLLPRKTDNLLVPVAVSTSHVGFCALRLEPIWMSLGQAAGTAAHLAVESGVDAPEVAPADVRRLLHRRNAATIYVADVPRTSADFEAVQWWGALGGWHGLERRDGDYGERGEHLRGQYYHAFPHHEAALDRELDPALEDRWLALAAKHGVESAKLKKARTRGEFVRLAHRSSGSKTRTGD